MTIRCPICSIITNTNSATAERNWLISHMIDYHSKSDLIDFILKTVGIPDNQTEKMMEWNEWAAEMAREQK